MAIIIDGKEIARRIRQEIAQEVKRLKVEKGITPILQVIMVGDNPASKLYVSNKKKGCKEVGIISKEQVFPENVSEEELKDFIHSVNHDKSISGILLQLPLPKHLNEEKLISLIDPKKDVDGIHPLNIGKLVSGKPYYYPCTPLGIIYLINEVVKDISGKKAVVIGRSKIVGKPVSLMLLSHNATVTICHSKTEELGKITSEADILVVAVGKPNFITADMVNKNAVVIDVGTNKLENRYVGDVDFPSVSEKVYAITPVPGGVGPMTVTFLLKNTLQSVKDGDF